MTINNQLEGTTLTMAIEGRIDTQTAPELQKAVDASIGDVKDLILDFSKFFCGRRSSLLLSTAPCHVFSGTGSLSEVKRRYLIRDWIHQPM